MNTVQKCECASCGRYFVRDSAFFKHRTGVYADGTRRCMTEDEMRQEGMDVELRDIRVEQNGKPGILKDRHVWFDRVGRETMRKRFLARGDAAETALPDSGG
jgi:hypothetical protein